MSTDIKNTTTGEIIELECIVDGQDILDDVLAGAGVTYVATDEDGSWAFALEDGDVDWWRRWAEREERIAAAYEDANEAERKAYEQAINDWGHDYERLQDLQEVALGLAGYRVVVYDADESCDEVLVSERHATLDEARARFDKICAEDGWRDGLEAAIFEVLSETTEVSVEAASL